MKPETVRRIAASYGVPESVVEHLLAHDATFREMWNDLEQTREMEQHWRDRLPRHLDRIDEYNKLVRDLEVEVGGYLEQHRDADVSN